MLKIRTLLLLCLYILTLPWLSAQENRDSIRITIDSIMQDAIDSMAFPGAQLLIMKGDSILLRKAYGHHTYAGERAVEMHHLYDLASVTKVLAGGLALMKLQDDHLFYPDQTLKETISGFNRSEKGNLTWREILAHQSGMIPYIVFWQKMKGRNGNYKWRTFKSNPSKRYDLQIDSSLYLHRSYPAKMKKIIKKSQVRDEKKYLYSGLGFLLIPELVRERSGMTLDQYLENKIYKPLRLERICFNPLKKFPSSEIVPTEMDTFFRHKLVSGFVHDENASMLSGISSNAGLFANADDIGRLAQLLLYKGRLDSIQIFKPYIVDEYTSVQYPENNNRRGLTFDKPSLEGEDHYIAPSASPSSFGHSGFTGTFFWVDPEFDLIFVLLTNRVYPSRDQRKLYTMNLRPKLHELSYDLAKNK